MGLSSADNGARGWVGAVTSSQGGELSPCGPAERALGETHRSVGRGRRAAGLSPAALRWLTRGCHPGSVLGSAGDLGQGARAPCAPQGSVALTPRSLRVTAATVSLESKIARPASPMGRGRGKFHPRGVRAGVGFTLAGQWVMDLGIYSTDGPLSQ